MALLPEFHFGSHIVLRFIHLVTFSAGRHHRATEREQAANQAEVRQQRTRKMAAISAMQLRERGLNGIYQPMTDTRRTGSRLILMPIYPSDVYGERPIRTRKS